MAFAITIRACLKYFLLKSALFFAIWTDFDIRFPQGETTLGQKIDTFPQDFSQHMSAFFCFAVDNYVFYKNVCRNKIVSIKKRGLSNLSQHEFKRKLFRIRFVQASFNLTARLRVSSILE